MQRRAKAKIESERPGLKKFAAQMLKALKDQPDPIEVADALAQIAPEFETAKERRRAIATRIALLSQPRRTTRPRIGRPKLKVISGPEKVLEPVKKLDLPDTDMSQNGMPDEISTNKAAELSAPEPVAKKKKEPMAALSLDAAADMLAAFGMPDEEEAPPKPQPKAEEEAAEKTRRDLSMEETGKVPEPLGRSAETEAAKIKPAKDDAQPEENAAEVAPAAVVPVETRKARRAGSSRIISSDSFVDDTKENAKTTAEGSDTDDVFVADSPAKNAPKVSGGIDFSAFDDLDAQDAPPASDAPEIEDAEVISEEPAPRSADAPETTAEAETPKKKPAKARARKTAKAKSAPAPQDETAKAKAAEPAETPKADLSALADPAPAAPAAEPPAKAKAKPGFDLSALSELGDQAEETPAEKPKQKAKPKGGFDLSALSDLGDGFSDE